MRLAAAAVILAALALSVADDQLTKEQLDSIFGQTNDDAKPASCGCPAGVAGPCECVPYYQCPTSQNANGPKSADSGAGGACSHYLEACCAVQRDAGHAAGRGAADDSELRPPPPAGSRRRRAAAAAQRRPCPCPAGVAGPCECKLHFECPDPDDTIYDNGSSTDTICQDALHSCCTDRNSSARARRSSPPDLAELSEPAPAAPPRCGVPAGPGRFPWMVAVREHGATKCGGALITPQVVITAAHCVNQTKAHELSVAVGVVDTSPGQEGPRQGQVVAVEDVVAHPYFYHTSRTHFNVALLLLNDPVRLDRGVGTICMPGQEQSFAGSSGCVVSAWGDPAGKNSNKLKTLEVPVVPYARCKELIRKTEAWKPPGSRYFLDISLLCAGGNSGSGVCKGDEGSPLVCPMPGQPGRHQLAGVVAFAWPSAQLGRCGFGEDVPDMYANVGLVRSWVDDVLKSHRMDSSAYWP